MRAPATAVRRAGGIDAGDPTAISFDFPVSLANFEGPFDLLLSLIGRHKLDVTEIALSKVTDDFVAYLRAYGPTLDLETASQFLVVAATLLDLKAARLLPAGDVEDEEDVALLEARDLLFARLLQYRAYKRAATVIAERLVSEERRHIRVVGLEGRYLQLLPEVLLGLGPQEFAALATRVLAPRPAPPLVGLTHLHVARVSVREQAELLADRLRQAGHASFRALTADCDTTVLVVGRFLALLELYRERLVAFDQIDALGELHVRWIGGEAEPVEVEDEYEQYAQIDGAPDESDGESARVIDIRRGEQPTPAGAVRRQRLGEAQP